MAETLIFEDDIGTTYEDEPSVDLDDATVVLAEQTLTFNGTDQLIIELSSPLVVGQTYRVMWDGTAYTSTAADLEGVVFIGNAAFSGLDGASDTGEPFAIAYFDGECAIFTLDAGDHTVAVYHVTEDEPSVDPEEPEEPVVQEGIVLKDRNGNDVAYYGIETVTFDTTTEGKQQTYTKGVAVEGLEIVPDFSGGDMAITAAEGTLVKSATVKVPDTLTPDNVRNGVEVGGVAGTFIGDTEAVEVDLSMADGDMVVEPSADGKVMSSVTIKKPETLIPENIADGVNIAGIIGTLTAGGGIAFATGTVSNGGTISHNLGVVPDIIIAFPNESVKYMTIGTFCLCVVGFSSAFIAAYPEMPTMFYATYYNATSASSDYGKCSAATLTDLLIDVATSGNIHSANASTAVLSSMPNSKTYRWLAVGGLT